ncbi:hypothetical protein HAX54_031830, partial [Datura stramonium]|nr:hypothetical protein [Datura stramonium]
GLIIIAAKLITFLVLELTKEGELLDVLPGHLRHLVVRGESLQDLLDSFLHTDEELIPGAPLPLLSPGPPGALHGPGPSRQSPPAPLKIRSNCTGQSITWEGLGNPFNSSLVAAISVSIRSNRPRVKGHVSGLHNIPSLFVNPSPLTKKGDERGEG